jgi:hypothetical protein
VTVTAITHLCYSSASKLARQDDSALTIAEFERLGVEDYRRTFSHSISTRLPAVANTIEEARYPARRHGRSQILATDIRTALLD